MKTIVKFIAIILLAVVCSVVCVATVAIGLQMGTATATVTQAALERESSLYPSDVADEHFELVYRQAQKVRQELLTGPWAFIARAHALVKMLLAGLSGLVAICAYGYIVASVKKAIADYKEAKRIAKEKVAQAARDRHEQMRRAKLIRDAQAEETAKQIRQQERRNALIAQMNEINGED